MPSSITEQYTAGIVCELHVHAHVYQRSKHDTNLIQLVYLDVEYSKTRWMNIVEHGETLVGHQVPVGNL